MQQKKQPKKEIGAGIIVFRRSADGIRFLLLYKSKDYWNFPRGTVESEERSFHAALRETKEETGLSLRDLRIVRNFKDRESFRFKRNNQPVRKIVILFLAETRKREISLSSEHQGYAWLTYVEAERFLSRFRANTKPLKRAQALLVDRKKEP